MLDVHPPHEKIHGIGDFLLHLFTITVGLLIALGLEGCVERMHQRHLRQEADTNLRQEIRDNEKEVASALGSLPEEKQQLQAALGFLRVRADGKPLHTHTLKLAFEMGTLSDASWRTAAATGALSLMEYRHVQRYATAYQLQEQFAKLQEETLSEFLQTQSSIGVSFDKQTISPVEAEKAIVDVRRVLAHLGAIDQIGAGLDKTYREALRRSRAADQTL